MVLRANIILAVVFVLFSFTGFSQGLAGAEDRLLNASWSGNIDSVRMALDDGADVNAKTYTGVTALMYAAQGGFMNIIELLLERGANPDLKPADGRTALMTAASTGHLEVAETLIRSGAGIDLRDDDGATALMHAVLAGDFYMTDMLLYYRAAVNAKADDSTNALMLACYKGFDVLAGLLLKHGSKTDEFDRDGFTALLLNPGNGNTALTDTLYKYRSNFNRKIRNSYISPLDLARIKNDKPVARMIRKYAGKGSLVPYYDRIEIRFAPADFNFTDYMMGGALSIFDSKFNTSWTLGFSSRPARKRILEEHEGYYLQLREKRSKINLTLEKMFVLPGGDFELRYGPFISASGLISWGNFEGLNRKPETKLLFVPGAGFACISGNFNFRVRYAYENYSMYKVSPHRVELSLGVFINLPAHQKVIRTIRWF